MIARQISDDMNSKNRKLRLENGTWAWRCVLSFMFLKKLWKFSGLGSNNNQNKSFFFELESFFQKLKQNNKKSTKKVIIPSQQHNKLPPQPLLLVQQNHFFIFEWYLCHHLWSNGVRWHLHPICTSSGYLLHFWLVQCSF